MMSKISEIYHYSSQHRALLQQSGKHPANTALPSDPISLNLVPT